VFNRLFCAHEIFLSKRLRLPVVLAASLASTGSCNSESGMTSREVDEDQLRNEITCYGKEGYYFVNHALQAVARTNRLILGMEALRWLCPMVLLLCADRRVSAGRHGPTGLEDFYPSAGGLVTGVLTVNVALCCMVKYLRGVYGCWASTSPALACSMLLVCTAVAMAVVLVRLGDLQHSSVLHWRAIPDLLTSDCFGYSDLEDSCPAVIRFWSALIQSIFGGGCLLGLLPFGMAVCSARLWCCIHFIILVLVLVSASLALAPTAYTETWNPFGEFLFPLTTFVVLKLWVWVVAPFHALWAGASHFGLESRYMASPLPSRKPSSS